SVVCTDSFHGTVFSLIFEKEFWSFAASGDPSKAGGSRQYNILDAAGLLSRLYSVSAGVDGFRNLLSGQTGHIGCQGSGDYQGPADYRRVREKLQEKRDESLSYLKKALIPGGDDDCRCHGN